jgi:hypothetical protein
MELIDYGSCGSSSCSPCSNCTKLKGCANGVPYLVLINQTETGVITTYINLNDSSVSSTAPAGFNTGDCVIPERNLIGGVMKVTDNPLSDGTTEYPTGFDFGQLPEISAGTHRLRSFSYKIYWNGTGEFLDIEFADTGTRYHYDDAFYHGTSRMFSEDTHLDLQYGNKIIFNTRGRSFFEINYTLEQI